MASLLGSCSCAVGRGVDSDTKDPRFKSGHWQFYLLSTQFKTLLKRQK